MNSAELRELFVEFFKQREHKDVASSPLIPPDDPSLLFTSAGMVQFKALWSGKVALPYTRAVSVQKCFRAGGKASDLENVGRTLRHLSFFEMLGNFSFGDYFKRESIRWAWEFMTQVLKIGPEKFYVSVYKDDDEAYDIWHKEIGLAEERIVRLGEADNFWGPAGDTGACGPCSELHMDMGPEFSCGQPGCTVGCDCERYLEFWNLVFPQFDQQPDGSRLPLKNRGIDTGMGLERLACIVQHKPSLYETDLLYPIVQAACEIMGVEYKSSTSITTSINIITDHIRGLTFILGEGVIPSNEGRGYVLRRVLRRASLQGRKLNYDQPFLYKLVDAVIDTLGQTYPEIKEHPDQVKKIIRMEEERFHRTLSQGLQLLERIVKDLKQAGQETISGAEAFRLYDTYGFPVDITMEIAEENGLKVDEAGFNNHLAEQKRIAKVASKGAESTVEDSLVEDIFNDYGATQFVGYQHLTAKANIIGLIKDGQRVDAINKGEKAIIILDETPFYGEAGGQIGDKGKVIANSASFNVKDTQKTAAEIVLHYGEVTSGGFKIRQIVEALVDEKKRLATMKNHTVTHLLQGALKKVVGKHITQSGSLVCPDYLRFDFTHVQALTPEQIQKIERIVNELIMQDLEVTTQILPREEARQLGAIAPFGEKYGATVRVIKTGDFSLEFCGGTHLDRTGKIGLFVITGESSIAAGVRRIEALTGETALAHLHQHRQTLRQLSQLLTTPVENLPLRVEVLLAEIKSLKRAVQQLRLKIATLEVSAILQNAREIKGIKVLTHKFEGLELAELRNIADIIKARAPGSVTVVGSVKDGKVALVCAVTEDIKEKLPAHKIIRQVGEQVNGGGGGRADLAQAGGKNPQQLDQALENVYNIVASMV